VNVATPTKEGAGVKVKLPSPFTTAVPSLGWVGCTAVSASPSASVSLANRPAAAPATSVRSCEIW